MIIDGGKNWLILIYKSELPNIIEALLLFLEHHNWHHVLLHEWRLSEALLGLHHCIVLLYGAGLLSAHCLLLALFRGSEEVGVLGDDAGDGGVVFDHFLVVGVALGGVAGLDEPAHQHVHLQFLLLLGGQQQQAAVLHQEVDVAPVFRLVPVVLVLLEVAPLARVALLRRRIRG